jgi:uncharacterized protein YbaR (Trm112 family)
MDELPEEVRTTTTPPSPPSLPPSKPSLVPFPFLILTHPQVEEANKVDEAFLQLVHKLLLDVHVLEGALVCPETGRRFPINEGIPNMLLHEDEVA